MNKPTLPDGWKSIKLREIADKCTARNHAFTHTLVLTISAQRGIVPQTKHFDKDIAVGENIDGYFVVNDGEFVYNPRISTSAPCGPIRRNNLGVTGVMSPLYTIFNLKKDKVDGKFIEYYFLSTTWNRYIKSIANYGARHDRMSITNDSFFAMPIPLPPLAEQRAIAEILTNADNLIAVEEHLIAAKQKKWLMQNLLTGKIRLPGFCDEWKQVRLRDYLTERKQRNRDNRFAKSDVLSVSRDVGIVNQIEHMGRIYAGQTVQEYHIVEKSDIVYTKSPLKNAPYGIFKTNYGKAGIVSTLYAVYKCKNSIVAKYLDCFFSSNAYLNNYLRPLVRKGAKNDMKVNNETVISGKITLPPLPEQQAIVEVLTTADREIELLKKDLEQHKFKKKFLMQQLLTGKIRVKGAGN